ncbi:hypothetical protein [Saliphagus infecundisoli]|uniref:M42 glutamyl aminopeptidase n=1 Tax=Saliphagus infecundisoli TaxID=1849069 RepID=A0ABD5QA74_9EURY|nr:hypothetical protein [Saliphagus infecundisoli]
MGRCLRRGGQRDRPRAREIPRLQSCGGCQTAGFQHTNGAKPVGAISIPTRYLHTVTETAHVDDVAATIDLLSAILETEDGDHDYRL